MFAPDGKTLISGSFGEIYFWDLQTGKEIRSIRTQRNLVSALAFSPDGKTLASACASHGAPVEGTIELWDPTTGKKRLDLHGHHGAIYCLAFSPDGKLLASGGADHSVRFWDVATGAERFPFEGHVGPIRHVAMSLDGNLVASAGSDHTIRLWDPKSGKQLRRLVGHRDVVHSVAFAPNGKTLYSSSDDGTMRHWDLAKGEELAVVDVERYLLNVVISPDGKRLASGGGDQFVRIADAATLKEYFRHKGHTWSITSLAFSPDGEMIASSGASYDRTIRLWHVGTGKELRLIPLDTEPIDAVAFSRDGKTLVVLAHTTIHLLETDTGREIRRWKTIQDHVHCAAFLRGGARPGHRLRESRSASGDLAAAKEIRGIEGHYGYVSALCISVDGKSMVTGSADASLLALGFADARDAAEAARNET